MKRTTTHRPERDRMVFAVLRAIKGKSPTEAVKGTYVSPSTVAKWRLRIEDGGTRYPQHHTMAAVARAAGLEFQLVPVDDKRGDRRTGYRRPSSEAPHAHLA